MPVLQGSAEVLDDHPGRTLFVCWGSGVLQPCLERYRGDTILIVEEECADSLHNVDGWIRVARYVPPRWPGIRDDLCIYRRAPVSYLVLEDEKDVRLGDEVQLKSGWEKIVSIQTEHTSDMDWVLLDTAVDRLRLRLPLWHLNVRRWKES